MPTLTRTLTPTPTLTPTLTPTPCFTALTSPYIELTPTAVPSHHIVSRLHPAMCKFTQREYSCGHFKFIAARWCNNYRRTHRRCQPDIAHFEYRAREICGQCRPREVPAWQHLIPTNTPVSITGITGINSLDDCCRDMDLVPWLGADRPGSCTRRRPPTPVPRGASPPSSTAPTKSATGVSGSGRYAPSTAASSTSTSSSSPSPSPSPSHSPSPSPSSFSSSSSAKLSATASLTARSSTVLSGKIRREQPRRPGIRGSIALRY